MADATEEPMVKVTNLTFSYETRDVLRGINLDLHAGQRMLLIGANGAGKSTLLRVLGGRHMFHPDDAATILGRECFHDTRLNLERSYLDTQWGMRTVAFAGYGVPMQVSKSQPTPAPKPKARDPRPNRIQPKKNVAQPIPDPNLKRLGGYRRDGDDAEAAEHVPGAPR